MVELRLATPTDFTALMALSVELMEYNIGLGQRRPRRWEDGRTPYFRSFVSNALDDPSTHHVVVAEESDRIVATCHTALKGADDPCPAYVHTLIVTARCRGRGIGRRLLDDAFAWCAARGADEVGLNVAWPATAARRFYEAYAFEPVNTMLVRAVDLDPPAPL